MGQQSNVPNAPNFAKDYDQGFKINLKYLPKFLQKEMHYRRLYDPQRIKEAQDLQDKFGPNQYRQQLAALNQLDPEGQALRRLLYSKISGALENGGINPLQGRAYNQLGQLAMSGAAHPFVDPQQGRAYNQLGTSVRGQANRGGQLDPESLRQIQQTIRSRQGASGNSGNAADMAEAVYVGQRAQQLQQQRLSNLSSFTAMNSPFTQARQQGFQNLAGFTGMQSPQERSLAEAGSFLSLPTPEQQIGAISSVAPDRAQAYVNPNSGAQGLQWGLQNYQNQLAQYQAGGGATNPWMNALGGAAAGAAAGTSVYPGYGTVIGGVAGGLSGYFSDARLKSNIVHTGKSHRGIPEVEFDMAGKRYRGVLAQDVIKKFPEAVFSYHGRLGVHYDMLGTTMEEI